MQIGVEWLYINAKIITEIMAQIISSGKQKLDAHHSYKLSTTTSQEQSSWINPAALETKHHLSMLV